jgi:ribosomal-protein-alanine N-acetyltransferase
MLPHAKKLHTDHLTLHIATPETMDQLFQQCTDTEISGFMGISLEQVPLEREKYKLGLTRYDYSFVHFFLSEKDTQQVIGWAGYHVWNTKHHWAEIGYKLFHDRHKRKGWMTEVLREIIPYGFQIMNLHRIEARVGRGNMASLRLLEKFGFQQEGLLRANYLVGNTFEDSLIFGLLHKD